MTPYQQFIHLSRYARWNQEHQRRETWDETVSRYVGHFAAHLLVQHQYNITPYMQEVFNAITQMSVMPSMRCLMMAGPALAREPLAGYNCSYRAVDDIRAFDEIMYALMCGTGAGFSVERQFIGRLPMIPRRLVESFDTIVVEDSREGWCQAYQEFIECLYAGKIKRWNIDKLRPAGARLVTTGGYASGPGPLVDLFEFTVNLFKQAQGRRLNSLECHDLVCKIGEIVVVGGVRRSALISLSNLSDMRMRQAKMGNWYTMNPSRALANNSVAYTEKPTVSAFMEEWLALYESKSGERGIINRVAAIKKCESIGRRVWWDEESSDPIDPIDFGFNPCSEIILRSAQLCNLTEVVVRSNDTFESLKYKVELATMLGTWQSTLTKFNHLGPQWQENCEEERLLGVSMTGIMDSPLLNKVSSETAELLRELRQVAWRKNREIAAEIGIQPSAAITTVKPSGTVGQLVNSASGIHARYSPFYMRRVIMGNHDPICTVLKDQGVKHEPSVYNPENMTVFAFPTRSPEGSVFEGDRSAVETLEHYRMFRNHWTDHNVSITVTLDENEWPRVGAWVWDHFDEVGGVSFLPRTGMVYKQAPYEKLEADQYQELLEQTPRSVDWSQLQQLERTDTTKVHHELACTANGCEVV